MDKLRALHYLVACAEAGSFAAAGRRLDVSTPAVLKLIGALERELGAPLFDRSPRGLALTADGARCLDRCAPLLKELEEATAGIGASVPQGQLVAGIAPFELAFLAPRLAQFHARYPDISLDVRPVRRSTGPESAGIDVFVMPAWQDVPDLVRKVVAHTPYCVVAAPAYWAERGMPRDPRDLASHACLVLRSVNTLLDVWEFSRGGEARAVAVSGWLTSGSREALLEAALAGAGVMRARHLTVDSYLRSGRLVAALADWTAHHAPPVAVMFRPKHRRNARVRAFVEFVAEAFGSHRGGQGNAAGLARPPSWWGSRTASGARRPRAGGR